MEQKKFSCQIFGLTSYTTGTEMMKYQISGIAVCCIQFLVCHTSFSQHIPRSSVALPCTPYTYKSSYQFTFQPVHIRKPYQWEDTENMMLRTSDTVLQQEKLSSKYKAIKLKTHTHLGSLLQMVLRLTKSNRRSVTSQLMFYSFITEN